MSTSTTTTTELPKTYDPSSVESEAYRVWTEEKAFHAEPNDGGNPYAIVIPPPNVTAALHLGHALNNTIQDILTRYRRMAGDNAVWLPGTDHAGIATQTVVDKRLQASGEPALKDYKLQEAAGQNGREQFLGKVKAWKDEYEQTITAQLKAMGCSCDWDRQAFTMDEPRAKAVREAFFRLFKDGLIYRGKRLVNWDPATQTALADDEVEMEEVDGNFYYLRYPLVPVAGDASIKPTDDPSHAQGEDATLSDLAPAAILGEATGPLPHTYITVATTRPETMLGDTAVAINPKDPRAAALRGRKVLLPIVGREIPIVEDDYVVLPASLGGDPADPKSTFATGFLKVTPAHDPNDYEIGQRHKLGVINVMAPDASISDKHGWTDVGDAGFLLGKSREEARKLIVRWFKENGLLEEVKPYRHSVGHSYRSHVPIEPYLSDQWYCKVTDDRLRGAALRAMAAEQVEARHEGTKARGQEGEEASKGAPPRDTGILPVRDVQQDEKGGSAQSPRAAHGQDARVTGSSDHATASGDLRFYPARYAKTFQTWHENIRDWCISRQLWWGHRIPVWSRVTAIEVDSADGSLQQSLTGVTAQESESDSFPLDHLRRDFAEFQTENVRLSDGRRAAVTHACIAPGHVDFEQELEQQGFRQDPDVLDTWFSSGLWPMSTLKWPSETPELHTWNPSSVLTTAREIITLWVSRMVMFNLYFRDCLPFRDVFIHAMIQDGDGQKMSKSLGNGVDPLDIISSHGADAMRYTLAAMTTQTQDLRMPVDLIDPHSGVAFAPAKITNSAGYVVAAPIQTSPKDPKKKLVSSYGVISGAAKATADMPLAKNTSSKFDLGRNFCNKIWNAARFAMKSLGEEARRHEGTEARSEEEEFTASAESPSLLSTQDSALSTSLPDRWIVSRFNAAVADADAAMRDYRFDQYAKACYDFFWRDLCDWYLEAIKPAMKDPARAAQTANVLASVLDGALRLMHPAIPFITETIWWQLNAARPTRGLPGLLDCPPSERLVKASWPKAGMRDESAERDFGNMQAIIGAIRNVRNENNAKPSLVVGVSILAPAELVTSLESSRELVELLATCTLKEISPNLQPPKSAARASAAGCDVYVEGLVDEAAEQQRKAKRMEALRGERTAMTNRLSSEAYIAKAPPKLVQDTRDKLAAVEAELAKLEGEN